MRKGRSISELHPNLHPNLSNVNLNTTLSAALFSEYLQEKHYSTSRELEFPCASFNLVILALYLQEGGVEIDLKDGDEATPLHFAASRGHADCVSFFLAFKEIIEKGTTKTKTINVVFTSI
jgi:ankyrin repeat protein